MTQSTENSVSHTPGPWHSGEQLLIGRYLIRDDNGEIIAEVVPLEDHETTANARLIAAAPELLAEAKAFIAWINGAIGEDTELDLATQLLKLQIAITKAEGRS